MAELRRSGPSTTWARPTRFEVPADLFGYQVCHSRGLPPAPICTPGLASLEAALNPDTATGYLYFVAKNDGSGTHVFARTYAEHQANIEALPQRRRHARAVKSISVSVGKPR